MSFAIGSRIIGRRILGTYLWIDEEVAEGEVVDAEAAGPGQAVGVGLHQGDQLAQHDAVRENVSLKP